MCLLRLAVARQVTYGWRVKCTPKALARLAALLGIAGCAAAPQSPAAPPVKAKPSPQEPSKPAPSAESSGSPSAADSPIDCKAEFARLNPSTTETLPPEEQEKAARAKVAGERVASKVSGRFCPGSEGGGVLLRAAPRPDGSTQVEVTGGTVENCEVLECVQKHAEDAAGEVLVPEGHSARFGVFVEDDGKLSKWPDGHRVPTRTEPYCGVKPEGGRLPAESIRSTVRASFDSLRKCYEEVGLARDPEMTGMIKVRFVIGREGTVTHVGAGEYTFPECSVGVCILEEFSKLQFDKPDGGIVTVTYPIQFSPG